jgi:DNA polymerase-4
LRGEPIAVGGGVVLAASYEAKAFGISGGMSGRRARELCPQLIFVGGHFKDYQRLGDAAINVLRVCPKTSDGITEFSEHEAD